MSAEACAAGMLGLLAQCVLPYSTSAPICAGVPAALSAAELIPDAFQEGPDSLRLLLAPGDTAPFLQTMEWTFLYDGGDYTGSFGFCPESAFDGANRALFERVVDVGKTATDCESSDDDKRAFAEICISEANAVLVFDDEVSDPVTTNTVNILVEDGAGEGLVFFLLPDSRAQAFFDDSSDFYGDTATMRQPLFTARRANPGGYEQVTLFHNHTAEAPGECPCNDNAVTLFAWEDQQRDGVSDQDFGDFTFLLQGVLRSVPPWEKLMYCRASGEAGNDPLVCTSASHSSDGTIVRLTWTEPGVRCTP